MLWLVTNLLLFCSLLLHLYRYREKLPTLIKSRKEPHVLYDELVQIAKWRLMVSAANQYSLRVD